MITRTHDVGALTLQFVPPPTAKDVLDWEIYIQCIEGTDPADSLTQQLVAGVQWAAQFVRPVMTSNDLAELMWSAIPDEARYHETVALCRAIVASAKLPASILADIVNMRDVQNKIDPDWSTPTACPCPRCRRGKRGETIQNPPDIDCLYEKIDHRAMDAVVAVLGVQGSSEPYYVCQVRAALDDAESRRIRYQREQRELQKDSHSRINSHPAVNLG